MFTVENDPPVAQILRLLRDAGLPTADIGAGVPQKFFGLRDAANRDNWIGVIGVERYGDDALLRSLAVDPAVRGRGVGAALVAAVEAWARANGCARVVLLTTTARGYFSELGYRDVPRGSLSAALAASSQAASVCPTSAAVMAKVLG